MDVTIVNPFISSAIETFKTMLDEKIIPAKPYVKKDKVNLYDVSGIIGISGKAQGSIALSFSKNAALKVVSRMLGYQLKVIGPELSDGIGELTNIIVGYAKKDLTRLALSISLPNVIVGKHHMLKAPMEVATMVVPFTSGMGEFAMEVTLKTSR